MGTINVDNIKNAAGGATGITIDGAGNVFTPTRPMFRAFNTTAGGWSTVTHNEHQIMAFNGEVFDLGGNFSTSTYRFTCPVDGLYFFGARAYMHTDGGTLRFGIITGTTNPATDEATFLAQDYRSSNVTQRSGTLSCEAITELTAGTQVGAYVRHDSDTNNSYYSENNTLYNHFEGYLIG